MERRAATVRSDSVKAKRKEEVPYHRRTGVIWCPSQLGVPREPRYGWLWQSVWANDGGDDAPLSPRGLRIYHLVIGGIVIAGMALLIVTVATR
jgi:hypothetical protein